MMQELLLVTNAYPFGKGEATFIQPELEALSKTFQITIVSRNSTDAQTADLPQGIHAVYRYASHKQFHTIPLLFRALFSRTLWQEFGRLVRQKRLSKAHVLASLKYVMRAIHFSDTLKPIRATMSDHVLLYTYWNDYSVLALSRIKQKGDRLISRIHGVDLYERSDNRYFLPCKEAANQKTDLIAFISKQGKDYFEEHYTVSAPKKVCYLGANPQRPQEWRPDAGCLHLFSFSNVIPVKRLDRMVDAIAALDDTVSVDWTHIGDGNQFEELKAKAYAAFSNRPQIQTHFLGSLPNTEALEWMRTHPVDLILNTSESEGLPVSIMEAMSFGIPALAVEVGGMRELIEDGKTGFLLPADASVFCIRDALMNYLHLSETEKSELHRRAYAKWQDSFDCQKNHQEFSKILQQL